MGGPLDPLSAGAGAGCQAQCRTPGSRAGHFSENISEFVPKIVPGTPGIKIRLQFFYKKMPPRCIFFKFLEDTLLGLIQDTMPPQAAILGEFEDHYTQILWPTLNVALTTTRNSNIQLDFSQKPRKNTHSEFGA